MLLKKFKSKLFLVALFLFLISGLAVVSVASSFHMGNGAAPTAIAGGGWSGGGSENGG